MTACRWNRRFCRKEPSLRAIAIGGARSEDRAFQHLLPPHTEYRLNNDTLFYMDCLGVSQQVREKVKLRSEAKPTPAIADITLQLIPPRPLGAVVFDAVGELRWPARRA